MEIDWQINLTTIKDRSQYLLKSEKLADCRFLVGTSSNQCLIAGHRLLLAMASPVFERMFYGNLHEKNNPIITPDIQPDAFKAMLDYIYTDEISILSVDNAYQLYYAGKKYMLPHMVEHCKNFLLANLCGKNACHVYEFSKLYEEPRLIEDSMKFIVDKTLEVIADPSFMDIKFSTLMAILDQNRLNIVSEFDLINSLMKFAKGRAILKDADKDKTDGGSENASDVVVEEIKMNPEDSNTGAATSTLAGICVNVRIVATSGNTGESVANMINTMDAQCTTMDEAMLRQAVKKIRFLTMTPKQFAEWSERSKLLQRDEALAILINISSASINDCPMPEGFCQSSKRDRSHKNHYCFRNPYRNIVNKGCHVHSNLEFMVDTKIYLWGIQLERHYREKDFKGFSASIYNPSGSEIASTDFIRNLDNSIYELTFNHPVAIDSYNVYKMCIWNNHSSRIAYFLWNNEIFCEGVKFFALRDPRNSIIGISFSK